jgi:hypothetical protein
MVVAHADGVKGLGPTKRTVGLMVFVLKAVTVGGGRLGWLYHPPGTLAEASAHPPTTRAGDAQMRLALTAGSRGVVAHAPRMVARIGVVGKLTGQRTPEAAQLPQNLAHRRSSQTQCFHPITLTEAQAHPLQRCAHRLAFLTTARQMPSPLVAPVPVPSVSCPSMERCRLCIGWSSVSSRCCL